jgi:hypothetical protein
MATQKFGQTPLVFKSPIIPHPKDEYENEYKIVEDVPKSIDRKFILKPLGGTIMSHHCQLNGAGMSDCTAANLHDKNEKIKCQEECEFFAPAIAESRCTWEKFGEYCSSIAAQDAAKL